MTAGTAIGAAEIEAAARALGLANRPVCVHVSLRSFGWLASGPATIIDGLVGAGCTVLAATMAPNLFMNRDPLTSMTGAPYGYVGGDPLNGADPSGLCTLGLFGKDRELVSTLHEAATHPIASWEAGRPDYFVINPSYCVTATSCWGPERHLHSGWTLLLRVRDWDRPARWSVCGSRGLGQRPSAQCL